MHFANILAQPMRASQDKYAQYNKSRVCIHLSLGMQANKFRPRARFSDAYFERVAKIHSNLRPSQSCFCLGVFIAAVHL